MAKVRENGERKSCDRVRLRRFAGQFSLSGSNKNRHLLVNARTGGFDLLMTGPDATKEKLQAEIRRQLGYVAHVQARPTNVLLLTFLQNGAPGLQPSTAAARGGGASSGGARAMFAGGGPGGSMRMKSSNVSIATLAGNLESHFQQPIVDRSGLTGNYDVMLNVSYDVGTLESDAIMQALPAQLGLGLTPGREPLDLLIVEPSSGN